MSPEQSDGKSIDHSTDVYSLGVILFQVCNGRLPFDAESSFSILYKHIHEPVPPMPHLPRSVSNVIETAMAKKPNERYPSAGALANAFGTSIAQIESETPAKQSTVLAQTTALFEKQPGLAYGGLALLLGVIGLALFLVLRGGPTEPPNPPATSVAAAPVATAETDRYPHGDRHANIPTYSRSGPTSTVNGGGERARFRITTSGANIYSGPGSVASNKSIYLLKQVKPLILLRATVTEPGF